jgi:hypothetical protein
MVKIGHVLQRGLWQGAGGDLGAGVDLERGLVVRKMLERLAGRLYEMEGQSEKRFDVAL